MEIEIEVVTADLPTGFDNPAHTVRGPRHVVTSGQTPVLDPAEERALLDSIDVSTHAGLRDRALIGLMVYSFARIGAARRSAWRSRMSTRKTDPFGCGCAHCATASECLYNDRPACGRCRHRNQTRQS